MVPVPAPTGQPTTPFITDSERRGRARFRPGDPQTSGTAGGDQLLQGDDVDQNRTKVSGEGVRAGQSWTGAGLNSTGTTGTRQKRTRTRKGEVRSGQTIIGQVQGHSRNPYVCGIRGQSGGDPEPDGFGRPPASSQVTSRRLLSHTCHVTEAELRRRRSLPPGGGGGGAPMALQDRHTRARPTKFGLLVYQVGYFQLIWDPRSQEEADFREGPNRHLPN